MAGGAYINPPKRIPLFIRLGLIVTKKVTGKDLLVPKLLAWYPKTAISSAVLEGLIAKGDKDLNERILKLVRVQASLSAACPFCIDMNAFEYEKHEISEAELRSLMDTDVSESFNRKERLAIEYTRLISATPVGVTDRFMDEMKTEFSEREIVILAGTAAQVNYWARLIKSLGVPPEGFADSCLLDTEK